MTATCSYAGGGHIRSPPEGFPMAKKDRAEQAPNKESWLNRLRRDNRHPDDPRANAWDKLAGREANETLANRDVFTNQQLDRSKIDPRQGRGSRTWGSVLLSAFVAVVVWLIYSGIEFAMNWVNSPTGMGLGEGAGEPLTFGGAVASLGLLKVVVVLAAGGATFSIVNAFLMRNLDAQNLMNDTTDINQYDGDQHIALPEEIVRQFDWFPDVGAHSSVLVSSMISHVMIDNKGLKNITMLKRADKDILDADGEIEYLKGEVLVDEAGEPQSESLPMVDTKFGDALFEASGLPDDKKIRRRFTPAKIPYNADGSDREKLGKYDTVADLINADWDFPDYEVQRPAGAYLVDTAPVNTMVLAITRAGKGQTYIEPVIDMWLREKNPNNMVINDPKGELLVKHYVRATMRGFQVVQFNLINAMKTDIYNPLGMAADAAREGDVIKCAQYVENIAEVFFPLDGGDDPFWANAANNAFKRVAYGLIDFYMEEERKLRAEAERDDVLPKVLDARVDEMWGKVTLYNCYQLFVQLTSKKRKSPRKALEDAIKRGEYGSDEAGTFEQERYESDLAQADAREPIWAGESEADLLSLYFNASELLPTNSIRTLIMNANNSLKSMGGAEKTLATVYGIAITAMSFFTDPTIMRLTSGTPSQNTDLGGLSFPRRMGVRFGPNYLTREHLVGTQARWSAYADDAYEQPLGEDFHHEDTVSPEGWARYYFKGKFENMVSYLTLELTNAQSGLLIKTFHFRFTKDYQTSLSGRYFITDPITGKKIVKNGVLEELEREAFAAPVQAAPVEGDATPEPAPQRYTWVPGHTTFNDQRLTPNEDGTAVVPTQTQSRAVMQTMVRYSETPKAVFLVTPPHLMKYAKLLLILIKQLVDLNFDKSYMTKSNQKPLYKTRFMLDELGNLQSEGHGIAGFETMLSIGLGQEQQFTIILQTLQQLRDVYGESVDKIVQGNASRMDSLIGTPFGWQRMGDTKLGDEVLTPFGGVTEVTGVFPKGTRPVYRVTLRDGSSSEVCHQHLWQIERWKSSMRWTGKDENGKRTYVGASPDGRTAVRVSEVIDTDELKRQVDAGKQVDLPRIAPVAYRGSDLPIDPYVLGVVLGDGHIGANNGFVHLSKNDDFVIEELRRRGQNVSDYGVADNGTHKYGLRGVGARLVALGLAGKRAWEKSIPEVYLYGSVEQRIDLLRGLMDTDGTISKSGEMEFISASRELAEDVQHLVRSLGGRVAINVKSNVMFTSPNQVVKKAARDAYRVQNIRLPKINAFLLPHKADRWRDRTDNSGNRVVSVEYVGEEEVQCISVADERHLYLTDDFMPTHNTSNIVFLKSTDDSMLDTLQKMSGTRHKVYRDTKTVTKDVEKIIKLGSVEGKVSYTLSAKEEPVISYNDMAFISERNSILFRAGDAPVWNRNETILPMSWRLFKDTISHPGHDYSLQTIPTLSSVADYDVRRNQPDFFTMFETRVEQAIHATEVKDQYRKAYGLDEVGVSRLDPDVYSDAVMELINELVGSGPVDLDSMPGDDMGLAFPSMMGDYEDNVEQAAATAKAAEQQQERDLKRYAEGQLSRSDLGAALDSHVIGAFLFCANGMYTGSQFTSADDGSLLSADRSVVYIQRQDVSGDVTQAAGLAADAQARAFTEDGATEQVAGSVTASWTVMPEFYSYLGSVPSWQSIANGEFELAMARLYRQTEEQSLMQEG